VKKKRRKNLSATHLVIDLPAGLAVSPFCIHSCPLPHITRVTHTFFHIALDHRLILVVVVSKEGKNGILNLLFLGLRFLKSKLSVCFWIGQTTMNQ
jgi:hypothetical protein